VFYLFVALFAIWTHSNWFFTRHGAKYSTLLGVVLNDSFYTTGFTCCYSN